MAQFLTLINLRCPFLNAAQLKLPHLTVTVTPHFDGEKPIFHTVYDLSIVHSCILDTQSI